MSNETLLNAAKLINGRKVTIDGGEPTLYEGIDDVVRKLSTVSKLVEMITNGKEKATTLKLIALMEEIKNFNLLVSVDAYHENIDREIVEWAMLNKRINETSPLLNMGRAKALNVEKAKGCCCFAQVIDVDGSVYQCGCLDSNKLGNVNDGYSNIGIYGCGSKSRRTYARNL